MCADELHFETSETQQRPLIDAEAVPCFRAVCRTFQAVAHARAGEQVSPASLIRSGPSVATWAWTRPAFRDTAGRDTALACAVLGYLDMLECVLDHSDDVKAYDRELWTLAGDAGQAHVLQWLLSWAARLSLGSAARLDLSDISIGDEDIPHLASALCTDTTLASLSLGFNRITDRGGIHLASALATNATLTDLNVLDNRFTVEGARALVAVAESKPDQIKSLCGITADVTVADFSGDNLGAAGAVLLALDLCVNATVIEPNLCETAIGDDGAQHIVEALKVNATVSELDLRSNKIGAVGAQHISEALKVNATVSQLDLCCNDIGAVGAQHIAEALKFNATVTQLDLRQNDIGDEGAEHLADALAANATITELTMLDNCFTEKGVRALVAAPESKPNQIKSLCGIAAATYVDFSNHGLDAADAVLLTFDLRVNTTFTELDLSDNSIGAVGAQHIAEALKVNMVVTQLSLHRNEIGAFGAQHIAEALKVNVTVTRLGLRRNDLADSSKDLLREAWRHASSLQL
ncbi:hypothetical protein T492DRAFT_911531 [Pavlovales sp. CCMP2436]|nr:hypothetical protein T492DRAFT_911531 [Pavlovales sp. CCMP2436]